MSKYVKLILIIGAILIMALFIITKKMASEVKELSDSKSDSTIHKCGNNCIHSNTIESLSQNELHNLKLDLARRYNNDFRSWNYNKPDRWEYLSLNFADEIIWVNPEFASHKVEISKIFLNYINQRTKIINSESDNKNELAVRANAEFKYNLSLLIGIYGYDKWQIAAKYKIQNFNELKDSIINLIAFSEKKY